MAPSKQGRDPKAKPWRKGKSKNANKKGSIKSQIRSKLRLMVKITDNTIKEKLKNEISQLEDQMNSNKKKELERKLASKYHQVKFFERQKLTRLEKKTQKRLDDARAAADFDDVEKFTKQLEQVCMDQLYVAYYPNDEKYIALFANGIRLIDDEKVQQKRKTIRQRIINRIKNGDIDCKKSWVNMAVLKAKNFEIDMNNLILGEDSTDEMKLDPERFKSSIAIPNDNTSHSDKMFNDSNDEIIRNSNNGDGVESVSSEEKPDVMRQSEKNEHDARAAGHGDSSSTSSDQSISSDSDESLDSSDDPSDSDDEKIVDVVSNRENDEDSEDDFLVDYSVNGDIKEVFKKAKNEDSYEKKGDKSLGWRTQKQQHGAWKRPRTR